MQGYKDDPSAQPSLATNYLQQTESTNNAMTPGLYRDRAAVYVVDSSNILIACFIY